ncbi:MAG: chromosome segregation protein SMC, partial [Pseudomonadota bacterium]
QLTTLARQAKQAARYRELGTDLRRAEGILLYLRWKEAQDALTAAQAVLKDATVGAAQAETAVRQAAKSREAADAALPALREQDAVSSAILQRLNVQKETQADEERRAAETINALENRIAQLTADAEREDSLNADATQSIDRLKTEADELTTAGQGHDAKLVAAQDAAQDANDKLKTQEAELGQMTEDVARLAARHQSAKRFLEDAEKRLTKAQGEESTARDGIETAKTTAAQAVVAFQAAQNDQARATQTVAHAEETLAQTDAARADCQREESDARATRAEAQGIVNALGAEVSALSKLIARDTGQSGQILDQITVEPGLEKALGAALADDLKAPAIGPDGATGWAALTQTGAGLDLPAGVKPFAPFVTGPDVLTRRMAHIGLVDPSDGPRLQHLLQPGQRLVSTDGTLWRWDGFRASGKDAPSAAALRLEQKNRLAQLESDLATATQTANGAEATYASIKSRLDTLTQADQDARSARQEADRLMADAGRALSKAEAEQNLSQGRVETLEMAVARLGEEAADATSQVRSATQTLRDLDDLDAARQQIEDVKVTVEAARMTMMARRSAFDEVRREGEQREKRKTTVARDLDSWQNRLASASGRAAELAARREKAATDLGRAKNKPAELETTRASLTKSLEDAEQRRRNAADILAVAETALREAVTAERETERIASSAREDRARLDARVDAAQETVTAAADRITEDLNTSPTSLLGTLDVDADQLPAADTVENDLARLRRQRDALGAVNLRAEEDAREVQEEHDTLAKEKSDLEEAIGTLRSGIASLNKEGRDRLLTAFEEVNQSFGTLFTHLFGGGEA